MMRHMNGSHWTLVVEGDAGTRELIVGSLTAGGRRVVAVGTVAEAHLALDEADGGPNSVLLDLTLPDGPGTGVLRAIRERGDGHKVDVVVMTDVADGTALSEALRLAPSRFLVKPLRLDAVANWAAGGA
jgi:DNA-binding response OmpR family regulator